MEGILQECISEHQAVRDQQVVEVDAVRHRPELNSDGSDGAHLVGFLIVEIFRVGNLVWFPFSLVVRVVDHTRIPFT